MPAALYGLGEIARRAGKFGAARTYYRDALDAFAAMDYRAGMALALDGLATVAAAAPLTEEHAQRAARLFGAADAMRAAIGVGLLPLERVERQRALAEVREALGDAGWQAQYAAGQAFSVAQALAAAISQATTT